MPQLSPEQSQYITRLVCEYIAGQRKRYYPLSRSLSLGEHPRVDAFFPGVVLESARLVLLPETEQVENPAFYPLLLDWGIHDLPDFSLMTAITFIDVIVSRQRLRDGLLFHELVHVEQYRQLGAERFAELYVRGFLSSGSYDGIPLEKNAYELGARFEAGPPVPFSVEDEVRKWAQEGRF